MLRSRVSEGVSVGLRISDHHQGQAKGPDKSWINM